MNPANWNWDTFALLSLACWFGFLALCVFALVHYAQDEPTWNDDRPRRRIYVDRDVTRWTVGSVTRRPLDRPAGTVPCTCAQGWHMSFPAADRCPYKNDGRPAGTGTPA